MWFYKLKTKDMINLENDSDAAPFIQKDVMKEIQLYVNMNTFWQMEEILK